MTLELVLAFVLAQELVAKTQNGQPKKLGKKGKPSEVNHGNVTPDIVYRRDRNSNIIDDKNGDPIPIGGFTITKAIQTTVISLPALRRLRFPLNGDAKAAPATTAAAAAASSQPWGSAQPPCYGNRVATCVQGASWCPLGHTNGS